MNLAGIDLIKLSKLTSQQIEHITCLECCKNYIAPDTATCGHTLCHNCWRGRKTCPLCTLPVERKLIKLNQPFQKLTEHVQLLGETFEKLFNIKLNEFLLDTDELETENDPTKNVKEWLASSQNQFSAPAQSSDLSSQDIKQHEILEVSSSKIQVHSATKKTASPEKIVHVSLPQDDWDKIESIPNIPATDLKNKENIIGPMDIEPFYIDDNEYTVNNPRRSSRKRDLHDSNNLNTNNNIVTEKENPKNCSIETDKKTNSAKHNWNNVKKMRKEFSKLNKINRNKLNVSIEMCKKTQSSAKPNPMPHLNTPQVIEIDENTPKINDLPADDITKANTSNQSDYDEMTNSKETPDDSWQNANNNQPNQLSEDMSQSVLEPMQEKSINLQTREPINQVKMPFYKKGALCAPDIEKQSEEASNPIKTINHNIESNSNNNEDIEITIKVGCTITNILIKKKNDVQVKVNSDREVQTSSCPQETNVTPPQRIETRNVSINIDSNSEVNIEHKQITQGSKTKNSTPEIKKIGSSRKSASAKKNTASADTGTGQFEITESVEKELSDIMECAEMKDLAKTKNAPNMTNKSSQKNTPQKKNTQKKNTPKKQPAKATQKNTQPTNQEDLSYLNDLDIFESDTVKENVQLLKHTKNTTPSEIFICTHNRNKTQKTNEKRNRDDSNDFHASKKRKLTHDSAREVIQTNNLSNQSIPKPDSESLNYDCLMGQVFANIDADMDEIKSQKITSQKLDSNITQRHNKSSKLIAEETQKDAISIINCTMNTNEFHNQKESENMFSVCIDKADVVEALVPTKEQVQALEPQPTDFLTPMMSRRDDAVTRDSQVIEIINDDSESVVEDTPQKDTSFSKLKKTSASHNSSQKINATESKVPSRTLTERTKTVVDNSEIKSVSNTTVIDTRKTLETPLTINKFVNHIQHNSTPVARKSLNFETEILDDLEQTLCPTNAAKTTQEREFMKKAFEKTPTTQHVKGNRNIGRGKRFFIAGSCLSAGEVANLKALCSIHKWSYLEKYTRDLTHLVVGVDEGNKSQRSVKYICALAASKWIVTSEWVEKCLKTKSIVGEEVYEALDSSGKPGPRRSRTSHKKLFHGITFYCMEPFSLLHVDTLKEILESSGGIVASGVEDVKVTDKSIAPAILLAEPESTQEDRFIYLAMEQSIVPVNFEWVLNCLGGYTLSSIQELLLCPTSLLPKATAKWPEQLMAREDD